MKKIVNPRLSLIAAICMVCGIVGCHEMLFGNYVPLIVCAVLLLALTVAFLIVKKRAWRFAAFALAVFLLAFGLFGGNYVWRGETDNYSHEGVLVGRVTDIQRNGNASNTVFLENCLIDGEKLEGRVKVYVYDGTKLHTGDNVSMFGTLRRAYVVKDNLNTSLVKNRVRYEFSDVENLVVESGDLTLGEIVRKYVYDVTLEYMPQNGDVAYALLTGDRNALDEQKNDAYVAAGIIHLLVVSGLHVGFVISIFGLFLKFFKLHPLVELLIMLVPLGFYAYVCDFSPSVMRALLMACCTYLARALFGKYDLLTSLCWAVTLILIVQPFYLYDVGFQLSVMSVLGISTLYFYIDRKFLRRQTNKILHWFLSTMAMSFSCTFATVFIIAYYFQEVVLLGLVINLLAIPLVFVAFALSLVSLLPSFFHYVAWVPDNVLQVVTHVAKFCLKLDAGVSMQVVVVGVVVCIALMFLVGGYVNLQPKRKLAAAISCLLALVICVGVARIPQNCTNCVRVFFGYEDVVLVATNQNGEVAVVGNFADNYASSYAKEFMDGQKISSVTLYVTDTAKVDATGTVLQFMEKGNVQKVYLLDSSGNDEFLDVCQQNSVPVFRAQPNVVLGQEITVQPVYDGGLAGVVVKTGQVSVANVLGKGAKANHFVQLRQDANYWIVASDAKEFDELGMPTLSFYQQHYATNFGANKYGNFTISQKDDKIILNFRRN